MCRTSLKSILLLSFLLRLGFITSFLQFLTLQPYKHCCSHTYLPHPSRPLRLHLANNIRCTMQVTKLPVTLFLSSFLLLPLCQAQTSARALYSRTQSRFCPQCDGPQCFLDAGRDVRSSIILYFPMFIVWQKDAAAFPKLLHIQ